MKLKKAVLISCFNYYDIRLKHVEIYLKENLYEVIYITSDFDHIAKEPYYLKRAGAVQVHAMPYKKNLSLLRMLSHFKWASDTFRRVKEICPDLLFVMLPPNSLARHAAKYRKKNDIKLIFDIYDLWPETYPFSKNLLLKLPFYFWKRMRDKYLRYSDLVTTECELYQEKLVITLKGIRAETLYPALEDVPVHRQIVWDDETVHLAYLGSINNIIDTLLIAKLISEITIHKQVHLHIIGSGESKNELIAASEQAGAEVTDYGMVFDLQRKQDILDRCRFGLNIMRNTVCVGLTMKSIDYFRAGLPIINTIKGDTAKLTDDMDIGFNLGNVVSDANRIVSLQKKSFEQLKCNTRGAYSTYFSTWAISGRLQKIKITEVL